jgi:predicted amidophosphoribosyltransferase
MIVRAGAVLLDEAEVLVPVPLHRWRLFRRRYNQAALLAQAVGALAQRPVVVDGLVRSRRTSALGTKGAGERRQELDGAFAVRPRRRVALAGRRVLLVDDVMTSGATAEACTRALLAAGAAQVDVLVAARVPEPGAA